MRRRHVLACAASAAVGVAGCLDRGDDGAPSRTSPPPIEVQTVTDAETCPEWPDELTPDSVREFLLAFEKAYLERSLRRLQDDVTDVEHDFGLSVVALDSTDDGYRATLSGGYAVFSGGPKSTYHGDVFDYEARYAVVGRHLRRTVSTDEAADPTEDGQWVTCPPRDPQTVS